jgi:hypothetical protein
MTTDDRFWSHVDRSGECWVWTGSTDRRGYGKLKVKGKLVASHRYSWMLAHGDFPSVGFVLHKCDNRPCVRPDHLYTGTHADNMADMVRRERARRSSLTDDDIRSIRGSNDMQHVIADRYGLSQSMVSRIQGRGRYPHVA